MTKRRKIRDCSFPIPTNAPRNTHSGSKRKKKCQNENQKRRRLSRLPTFDFEFVKNTWNKNKKENYRNYQIDRRLKACVILFLCSSKRRPKWASKNEQNRYKLNKITILWTHLSDEIDYHVVTTTIRLLFPPHLVWFSTVKNGNICVFWVMIRQNRRDFRSFDFNSRHRSNDAT